jgi:hypothetical protein
MKSKKHLSFGSLRKALSSQFRQLPDDRQEAKVAYTIHDALMCGFACMYFQDPSLLQFQKQLRDEENCDNLMTLFDVHAIPESTQMRDLIDSVNSDQLNSVFKEYFFRLQRSKYLKDYRIFPGLYLCPIDGTQYYSSGKVHCESCLKTDHKNGDITYSHKVLQAAIMHPDMRQVIPLMPEEICNSDGSTKQDCEINAAKRLVPKIRKDHPQLGLIITGDDLFSKQPFIETVLNERMHYILIAKPTDHVTMMNYINASDELKELRFSDEKGRIHVYEWINNVPLNGNKNPVITNFFRYTIISIDENGNDKINYKNSWVTDLEITPINIKTLVRAGRCRWKIENECFNTLKNQGYHIEHNYGHGQKHLCFNFYLLTLLAFFFHQIFELTDHLYQACREKFGSKRHMWETLRSYIKILIFETWELLLDFALTPTKYKLPKLSHCRSP